MMPEKYEEAIKKLKEKYNLTNSESILLCEVPDLILDRFPYRFVPTDDGKYITYKEIYKIDQRIKARVRDQIELINGDKALEVLNRKAIKFLQKCIENGVTIPPPDDNMFNILDELDKDSPIIPDNPFDNDVDTYDDEFNSDDGEDIDNTNIFDDDSR